MDHPKLFWVKMGVKRFFSDHILANSLTQNPYQQKVKLSDEKHIRVEHVDMSSE